MSAVVAPSPRPPSSTARRPSWIAFGVVVTALVAGVAAWFVRRGRGDVAWVALPAAEWDVVSTGAAPRIVSPPTRPVLVGESLAGLTRTTPDGIEWGDASPNPAWSRFATAKRGSPLVAGASVVPRDRDFVVPLSRTDAATDAVWIVGRDGAEREVPMPAGLRVVAARSTGAVELLSFGAGDGGSVAVVRSIVTADGTIEERERATVPYTPSLQIVPSFDQRCGLAGERFLPLVARGPSGGVLIAVTDEHLFPLRFALGERTVVTTVCGTCPPLALMRDGDDVTLLVTVGRKLAKSALEPLPERPVRDASGACTPGKTAVAVIAGGGVYVATTRTDGAWKLDPARRVDGLDRSPPSQVRLVADGARLTLFVGHADQRRVETRTSTDGGETWQ